MVETPSGLAEILVRGGGTLAQDSGARRRQRRYSPRQSAMCGGRVETLEVRLLLSATASPTFILSGRGLGRFAQRAAAGVAPIDPAQMRAAYGVNQISFGGTAGTGAGQTIAIVDAYNDPDILSDANSFSSEFGLQQFNVSGGPTLKVLNETGGTSLPANASGRLGRRGSARRRMGPLHRAQGQHHPVRGQLELLFRPAHGRHHGRRLRRRLGRLDELGRRRVLRRDRRTIPYFLTPSGHQGVTFLASTGDDGTPAGYPAFSPNVVAVGGTSLDIDTQRRLPRRKRLG